MVPEGEISAESEALHLVWSAFEKAKKFLEERAPGVELKCTVEIRAVVVDDVLRKEIRKEIMRKDYETI